MPSELVSRQSIARQLVLLFILAAALLLSCALGGLYLLVVRHAFAEDNAVLTDKLRGIRAELREPGGLKSLEQELAGRRTGESMVYWVRIVDHASGAVIETPEMQQLLPVTAFGQLSERSSDAPADYRIRNRLFSLLVATERTPAAVYTIQLAQDRSEDERFRTIFGMLLLLTLVVGTAVFSAIALLVTRRGLTPLRQMTTMVGQVGPRRLHRRLHQQSWPRELQPLAEAFDAMLARLEDAFVRLSQFSGDLAHELRTPVNNLLGEAQVALTRERSPEEYRAIIESSVAECERLSAIIGNLLFLARADAADRQIEPMTFDAADAVAKVLDVYETVTEEHGMRIRCRGEAQVQADPVLFQRAVNNLVDNAVRYTPAGGSVEVSLTSDSQQSQVQVKDTGSGIAPEHLPHVFDRFYRADRSRNSAGTGLGLSLVKSIMDLHGGSVAIASKPGRGTTVTLNFPKLA
jgi:two-component system heavy metal sensor histidine kinase CusS